MQETTLNLCDIAVYADADEYYIRYLSGSGYARFYLGSYFCGKYFCKTFGKLSGKLFPFFSAWNYKVTMVIPSPMEEDLERVKYVALDMLSLYGDVIDEVVINDFAMLNFIKAHAAPGLKLIAGRLMSKNFRDSRYPEYGRKALRLFFPAVLTGMVDAIECDCAASELDASDLPDNISLHLHYPYIYHTCGQNCEFASMMRPDELKFQRTFPMCMNGCMRAYYKTFTCGKEFIHLGKAVYSKQTAPVRSGRRFERYIYFPLDEWIIGQQ